MTTSTDVFESQRLTARLWTLDDVEAAFAMYGDAETMRYIGDGATQPDLAAARVLLSEVLKRNSHYRSGLGSWAVVEKATGKVVGNVILKPLAPKLCDVEVGWHLVKTVWGKGYAAEIARVIVEQGLKTVKLEEIIAVVLPGNTRSVAVTRKVGMKPMGQTQKYYDRTLDWFRITAADL